MTANFSTTRSAKAGDKVLPIANRLPVPAALRYSEIHKRYGEIFGLVEDGDPIIQMTSQHTQVLAQLNVALIQDEGHQNKMTLIELEQRTEHWLASQEYHCHAVVLDSVPIAYCLWRLDDACLYVRQLFTVAEHRGKGFGSKLIQHLQTHFADEKPLRLDVLSGNERAIQFYKKLGFELYAYTFQR